ncbi:Adenylate cyclase, class 3 [Ruegeria faecimaris]|uniref:Adenylate cyclase, class 3 n=1 Tax=Ruegeria faecimaris TaxID=686389 RepID=A0A521F125_9RHOB|nr:adenylate/guanylate cyclase domain-containing protein [Ruegeria faecimaris]SMO89898.1 Adenylate cyclase, class 3 [Ruegeria faecimaris]
MERRLTTILSIDVVGYSRLMERDESATLAALKSHRLELIDPFAASFGGKTIKLMGDGGLLEFESTVQAMRFAISVQNEMLSRNSDVPENERIVFRIGINIGDVIAEDGDIYGDGVNVAARIEGLAEPGGICIHRSVRDQVQDKLDLNFEDLGETEVKNIERPVRAFEVVLDDKAKALAISEPVAHTKSQISKWAPTLVGAVCICLVLAAAIWWRSRDVVPLTDQEELALAIPDEPSIVVLPFKNRSTVEEVGYMAEGFGTAITTQLSKFPQLFVIAGSTSITFADSLVKPREIGRELGVRYVLSGSAQSVGENISINATLIETESGHALWSEQYDVGVEEVFSAQADLVREIASTLKIVVEEEEVASLKKRQTDDPEAYELFLKAVAKSKLLNTVSRQEAIELLERAVVLDPDYLSAHIELSGRYLSLWRFGGSDDPKTALNKARRHAERALELDQSDYRVQHRLGQLHLFADHDHQLAYQAYQRAIRENSNDPEVLYDMGFLRSLMGEPSEAIEWNNKAKRVNPRYPGWYNFNAALSHFLIEDYQQALLLAKTGISTYPKSLPPRRILVATLAEMGRLEDAQIEADKLLEIRPDFRVSTHRNTPFLRSEDQDRYFGAMIAGGLPE